MKRIFLGTIALTVFSISLLLIQISCQEEVNAQTNTTTQQQGKILYSAYTSVIPLVGPDFWISNIDGTGKQKIEILLPTGIELASPLTGRLTPDGQTLIFVAKDMGYTAQQYLYSVSITDKNLKQITKGDYAQFFEILQAY